MAMVLKHVNWAITSINPDPEDPEKVKGQGFLSDFERTAYPR